MAIRSTDPLIGFQFSIKIEGRDELSGWFTEIEGVGSENEVVEHKTSTADGKEVVQMIPGRVKWSPVTLKRGITTNMAFWDWRQEVVNGDMETARTDCTIFMHDREGTAVAGWKLVRSWPSKISGPSMKTDSNDIGVEELTIVHENLERIKI
ncbi:MAG TPA: phage tail protein [Thermoflexia bacterium]|nr:phage tail protein [Thermoflexia bacterium]